MPQTQDESRVAEYQRDFRRTLVLNVFLAVLLNASLGLIGVGDGEDGQFKWPELSLTDCIQALAVLIVVIAAVAFGEDRSTQQGDIIDLKRSGDLRQVAARAGVLAPAIGLWGAISRIVYEGHRGWGGAALSLGVSLLLASLAAVINMREPARLGALERKRKTDAYEAVWDGVARWPRGVPTASEWADPKFRRGWNVRTWFGFGVHVAVFSVALALAGMGVYAARFGSASFLRGLDRSRGYLLLNSLFTTLLLFSALVPLALSTGSPSATWRRTKIAASVLLCLLALAMGTGTLNQWWWLVGLAPALALLIRIVLPGILGKRTSGVSRSWPSALVDHRFVVALHLGRKAAIAPADTPDDEAEDTSQAAKKDRDPLASVQVGLWRLALERRESSGVAVHLRSPSVRQSD